MPIPVDFCFRVSKEAKLAYNYETNEPIDAYIRVRGTINKQQQYDKLRESARRMVSDQFKIPMDLIIPISVEEYINQVGEDEDDWT